MDLGLRNRVALVTGAASGFGAAIALSLAQEQAIVWISDRDAAAADRTRAEFSDRGLSVRSVRMDVGDPSAVTEALSEVIGADGRIDILVCNAGLLATGNVLDFTPGEWESVLKVNLSGVLYCSTAAAKLMIEQKHGRIINIASISAMRGGGVIGNTLYGTTKAGVVALTLGLAREFGPHGITVNAIAPGLADTPLTRQSLTDELREKVEFRTPLRRLTQPSDVADAVCFLASDRARFITGTVLPVDGGLLTT